MSNKYGITEVIEEVCAGGFSIATFGARVFYGVSGLEHLGNAMNAFNAERFNQRLEYFTFEHERISDKEKEKFYRELEHDKDKLNYLYEFVEKARTSTYDIHAKILANLSARLIKYGKINYAEETLLVSLNTLTDFDIKLLYHIIRKNKQDILSYKKINISLESGDEKLAFTKLSKLDFITEVSEEWGTQLDLSFRATSYSILIFYVLDDSFKYNSF